MQAYRHKKESRPSDYQPGDCFVSIEALTGSYPETCEDEIEVFTYDPKDEELNLLG